jgi:hypothetical protein
MGLDPTKIFTYQEPARIDLKIPVEVMEYYRVFGQPAITDAFVDDVRHGIREPLRIVTDGSRAVLRDGHHRLAAVRRLGMTVALPVHVVPNWLGNLYVDEFAPPGVEPILKRWLADNETFVHTGHTQTELSTNDRCRHIACSCGADWRESL